MLLDTTKISIAIIDSGIDPAFPYMNCIDMEHAVGFVYKDGRITSTGDVVDRIGHGTGVATLIHHFCPEALIIPIKIMDETQCDSETFINALEYINDKISCSVINISLGVLCCDQLSRMYNICKKISESGTCIIAAFDNMGRISYPAAFDCVIGIDSSTRWKRPQEYAAVINSEIDIVGYNIEQRVFWLNGATQIVSGTSFVAPYFSGVVARMYEYDRPNFDEIRKKLILGAQRTIQLEEVRMPSLDFDIHKAYAFPYNKEMHSLARYNSLLQMSEVRFHYVKYSGLIGQPLAQWQWPDKASSDIIHNYDKICWTDDFDTFILGHVKELERAVGRNFTSEIVAKCREYSKQLYAFFDLEYESSGEAELVHFVPRIDEVDHNKISYKTYVIGRPILCVAGTSSRQGKFTVQLALREAFLEMGISVGQLGTEPSALLFGMDAVYPMGYESNIHASGKDAVYTINRIMGRIEQKEPDIIITGSQSDVHPVFPGGYDAIGTNQHEFLLGCQADGYILCVNVDDSVDDIKARIRYLESIYDATVIAVVISPMIMIKKWSVLSSHKNIADEYAVTERIEFLKKNVGIPTFALLRRGDVLPLAKRCIEFFS